MSIDKAEKALRKAQDAAADAAKIAEEADEVTIAARARAVGAHAVYALEGIDEARDRIAAEVEAEPISDEAAAYKERIGKPINETVATPEDGLTDEDGTPNVAHPDGPGEELPPPDEREGIL